MLTLHVKNTQWPKASFGNLWPYEFEKERYVRRVVLATR